MLKRTILTCSHRNIEMVSLAGIESPYSMFLLTVMDVEHAPFNFEHTLICRKGGLVVQRHNDVRDAIGDMASRIWNQEKKEAIVKEADGESQSLALIAGLAVWDVWKYQVKALFDIQVMDSDAQFYLSHSPRDLLVNAEKGKKIKYEQACFET